MTEPKPSSTFQMHGARAAVDAGFKHIESHVLAIERAIDENPGLAFDLGKTIIEAVCKKILLDRGVSINPKDDLPKLFKSASSQLSFLPPAAAGEIKASQSLRQTLQSLHSMIQALCELRNHCGFASHGGAVARPQLESVQALLAAEAADAVVGFLHRVHFQDIARPKAAPKDAIRDPEFDEVLNDEVGSVSIRDATFPPSDVLFAMEPDTYRIYLNEYRTARPGTEP